MAPYQGNPSSIMKTLQSERLKVNVAGIGGAGLGILAGEYMGTILGATVLPKGTATQQTGISIVAKALVGVGLVMFNPASGLAGIVVAGIGWGIAASLFIDLAMLANVGGVIGLAEAHAAQLSSTFSSVRKAAVHIDSAQNVSAHAGGRPGLVTAKGRSGMRVRAA